MVDITARLVEQLIAEQFPQFVELPISPVKNSGWDNRTFHLGDTMSVRLPSAAGYADAVKIEQTWLPWLAPQLPLAIPAPVAEGVPSTDYPWPWSIYTWLEGEVASRDGTHDPGQFARDLALFLGALQRIDTAGGPTRKFRGGSLSMWDEQACKALSVLSDRMLDRTDAKAATRIWNTALDAPFTEDPVWFHGDVAGGNLLVNEGRLSAVIDFGGVGVGDPGCDMTIAWTLLDEPGRHVFRKALGVPAAVWQRGKGWALWKSMIILAELIETNSIEAGSAQYALDQLIKYG